jgi:hypothetical protein
MEKIFQVHVFGKAGCEKCAILNKRLDQLLVQDEWQVFDKVYHDVETVEGLVAFSQTECMNPASIPGFVIAYKESTTDKFNYLPRLMPVDAGRTEARSLLYAYHGVQTDYSEIGKGVIAPSLVKKMLEQALQTKASTP